MDEELINFSYSWNVWVIDG